MDDEEKFGPPKKTAEDWMKSAMENLEEARFRFCVFTDHFRFSLKASGNYHEN